MHSDFSARGKSARELIPVPALAMDSIRSRSHAAGARDRIRAFAACGALSIGALGAAAGFHQQISDGVRVWFSGTQAAVAIRSFTMVRNPTAADLRSVAARATFPIVFPVGVPAGTQLTRMFFAPADHPNFVFVEYHNARANSNTSFTLLDSTAINPSDVALPAAPLRTPAGALRQWRAGAETVLGPRNDDRIETAMANASPSESLAAAETMTRRIVVLGGTPGIADIAEHLAPPGDRSVLLGPERLTVIPGLVKSNEPLFDSRTVYLSNIPSVHGQPDYSKATLTFPHVIAVSAGGVRAIDAVLRASGEPGDACACEILFNERESAPRTYRIWKIPVAPGATASAYTVDAATFAVTQAS
jgi:hypothetical protein